MTITCTTPGAWDAVLGVNAYLSKQQWQAAFLFVLCQMKAVVNGESTMSPCSVAGVWDAIQGNGYVTDQEFYKESLNTLCSIATAIGGGGVGSLTIGSGNPEGVVTAPIGARYWDDVGGGFYTKTTASGNTGWQAE